MITTAPSSTSSESHPNATLALAARVAGFCLRLLLVALLLLPVHGSLVADGAWAARLAICGVFCITLVRPEDGLLLCAAFLPIGLPLGVVLGFPSSLREPFALAFLAAWVLRETLRPEAPVDSATRAVLRPAWLLAAVVAASMFVQLAAFQPFEDFPRPYLGRVVGQLAGKYVLGDSYPGLAASAMMLEGLGLFMAAVVLCRRHAGLTQRVLRMAAIGGVAVAGLNVNRLAEICFRQPGLFSVLVIHPRWSRISAVFGDVNAAGSYMAMMLLVIAGLTAAARRIARWWWVGGGLLVAIALWFSGSRMGLGGAVVSGACVFFWTSRGTARRRVVLPAIVLAATALILLDWNVAGYATGADIRGALRLRTEFWVGAIRAFRDQPIFGVGIGRFWSVSESYIIGEQARAIALHENAHNNFLQILAELGCIGLAAFVWVLAAVVRRAANARGDLLLAGLASGVLAFLLTCVVGHPLLIPEVAFAFWLVLGITASRCADVTAPCHGAGRRRRHLAFTVAVGCLALSIPIRAFWFIENDADLSRAAIGFSDWRDVQGVTYRTMKGRARFYVPGSTCEVRLGLRMDSPEKVGAVDVQLRIDGQVANRVRAVPDSWNELRVLLRVDSGRRFRTVDLQVLTAPDITVMTSRPTIAECLRNPF